MEYSAFVGISALHEDPEWQYLRTLLPGDLDLTAHQNGALVRCRNISNAEGLVRIALAYAVSDLSLKDVAAWSRALGLAEITGPGVFYRLREAESWLSVLLAQVLEQEFGTADRVRGLSLRIVDATVLTGPGAKGTEWRAHVMVEPRRGNFQAVEVTDARGGEHYGRYPLRAGETVLGDRAYATARGLHAVERTGAYVLARLNPHNLRVCDAERKRIFLLERKDQVPAVGWVEWSILVPIPPDDYNSRSDKGWSLSRAKDWIPARVVAGRTRTGEIIWLITTAPAQLIPAAAATDLYRLRWQIELFFKRLKSLLHFDALPSRQGPTAKSWILSRLLAAALAQRLITPSGPLSPWGYEINKTRISE
jgi:hypothetical protein